PFLTASSLFCCPALCLDSYLFLLALRPRSPPLFPYTTLFRSFNSLFENQCTLSLQAQGSRPNWLAEIKPHVLDTALVVIYSTLRSEEHTSELQSRFDLVCRLLLENETNITT